MIIIYQLICPVTAYFEAGLLSVCCSTCTQLKKSVLKKLTMPINFSLATAVARHEGFLSLKSVGAASVPLKPCLFYFPLTRTSMKATVVATFAFLI